MTKSPNALYLQLPKELLLKVFEECVKKQETPQSFFIRVIRLYFKAIGELNGEGGDHEKV